MRPRRGLKRVGIILLLIALAALGLRLVKSRSATQAVGAKPGPGMDAMRPVPVTVAKLEQRDVPIWLEGLGSAAAFQQATVRTQIDGRLERVLFREGQLVRKGDLLAEIDARPYLVQLHQAEGALARDRAQLDVAQRDQQRYQELSQNKLISQQQADQQRGTALQATGALQVSSAAVESARLNLDYTKIRAPFDGTVGVRLIDAGNYVRGSDATGLVVLTQLDPAAVVFTLPEDQLPQVAAAQARGDVQVEIYSRDGQQLLGKGNLLAIDNQINAATASLRLKALVPNASRLLWPNEFVKVRMLVDTLQKAWVVPAAAVQRGPQGTFVYVVGEGEKATPHPITLQRTIGESAVIEGDLQEGAQVVTEGQNQIRPGAKVSVATPAHGGPPHAGGAHKGPSAPPAAKP